jgi:serine/threonine protein phosphatase PrpC
MIQTFLLKLRTSVPLDITTYTNMFETIFRSCNAQLAKQLFDVRMSGSTVVVVFFDGARVICANAGDSRAIKAAVYKDEAGLVREMSC